MKVKIYQSKISGLLWLEIPSKNVVARFSASELIDLLKRLQEWQEAQPK